MQGMHKRRFFHPVSFGLSLFALVLLLGGSIAFLSAPGKAHADTATIVTHQVTGPQVPVGQKGTLTVSCASGEQLLSGGFSGDAFEGAVYVVESYPSAADSWTVTVDNTAAPSWVQMTVSVYCLQADYSLGTTIVQVANTGSGAAVANCPAGSTLISGGYAGTTRLTASQPQGNGWQADTANVYAMCATQNVAATSLASATFTTPSNSTNAGATASCASGQLATGGGFSGIASGGGTPVVSSQDTTTGWSVVAAGSMYTQATVTVWAVCLGSSSASPTPVVTVTPSATITPTVTATPAPTIAITYKVNAQWKGGFVVSLDIKNNGTTAVNGWTLKFTFPGDQEISQLWNGVWSQAGQQVTITNQSYNGTIASGQTINLGFDGTWTSNNTSPTTFVFNGEATN